MKPTYIVLPGGMTCQLENPYEEFTGVYYDGMPTTNANWMFFNEDNPPLPLTKKMQEGDKIENWREVWQIKNNNNPDWETKNKKVYQNYDSFQAYTNSFGHNGFVTRIAIEPLEVEKDEKPPIKQNLTVEESALAYLNSIGITGKYQIEAAVLRVNDFIAGAQWQQSNIKQNLTVGETVEEAINRIIGSKTMMSFSRYGYSDVIDAMQEIAQWQQSNRPDNLHHLTDEELLKDMQDYSRDQDGWISVKDRLPESFVRVLVIDDDSDCFVDILAEHGISNDQWEYYTHWQPLPNKPKANQ